MDDTILFEISPNIDGETGIVNYYEAFMPKMYDDNGMHTPRWAYGRGDTEWAAIADLYQKMGILDVED